MSGGTRWHVFCNVIDHFGDAGVAWRLARLLGAEHGLEVTLWIDSLATLARIAPAVDPARDTQRSDGVIVRRLVEPMPPFVPADVVVEAFAGGLPDRYVDAMAERAPPSRWLRLEYLALEPQLDAHHRLPSPHPRLPLARTFWFPGFSAQGGGLLRERGLIEARDAFVADAGARDALWRSLDLAPPAANELRVSMFCYADAPLAPLLDAWSRGAGRVTCVVPDGVAAGAIAAFSGGDVPKPNGAPLERGALAIAAVPFVAQDAYDRMLWACDVNFVRGEDSFVRAQWAAMPFVWQAYRQPELAHATKVRAFVARYAAALDAGAANAVGSMFDAWNALPGAMPVDAAWRGYVGALAALREHGARWARSIAALPELASALVREAANGL